MKEKKTRTRIRSRENSAAFGNSVAFMRKIRQSCGGPLRALSVHCSAEASAGCASAAPANQT
eukprot:1375012-Prymnesium_polylepis.1